MKINIFRYVHAVFIFGNIDSSKDLDLNIVNEMVLLQSLKCVTITRVTA